MNFLYLEYLNIFIIGLAVVIILCSIVINFFEAQSSGKVKKEKKSVVETGSMLAFFIVFYFIIRLRLGVWDYSNIHIGLFLMVAAWAVIIMGVYFNVAGRFKLGGNWANHIRIYKNQTLATKGVYGIVRHPLYASLIWMFYAASIIYFNWLAFLLNSFIFIPFMYYRAKQEEKMLDKEFKNYKNYQKEVGMFFPKIKWKK